MGLCTRAGDEVSDADISGMLLIFRRMGRRAQTEGYVANIR